MDALSDVLRALRISGGVYLDAAFTAPWSAAIPLGRSDGRIYEYACHEGNYSLVGILSGARAEEKRHDDH